MFANKTVFKTGVNTSYLEYVKCGKTNSSMYSNVAAENRYISTAITTTVYVNDIIIPLYF